MAFSVIEGAGQKKMGLLAIPPLIDARSPFDRNRDCKLRVSKDHVQKAALKGRREPLYEFWSVLRGTPPPAPNVGHHETNALLPFHPPTNLHLRR